MGYNTETYYINPKADRIVTQQKDSYYIAYNVGKTNVTIAVIQGNIFSWTNTIGTNPIVPGQACIMTIGNRMGAIGVKVINNGDVNAFVHVSGGNRGYDEWTDSKSYFNLDTNNLLKTLVTYGIGKVPVIGGELSTIIGFFWPAAAEPSAWEQVQDKVLEVVDKKAQDVVKQLTGRKLAYVKERIKTCAREIDDPNIKITVPAHYMNIAEDLVGFEKLFTFDEKTDPDYVKANYVLLPLWATLINLKMSFYQYGIVHQEKVGLIKEQVDRLRDYLKRTVNDPQGAIEHANKVYKDKMADEYKHSYSEQLYDQLATVRAYCALNGTQHLAAWKAIAENPEETKRPYNPVVVFSTQFGRNNAVQSRRQVTDEIPPPLQPKEINGKLNIPTKVDVILSSKNSPKIGGLQVTYENGESATTGAKTSGDKETVDFGGKNLIKLTAHGTGQINALDFTFDDNSTKTVGTVEGDKHEFTLDNHRVVGFFMTGSKKISDDVSANIAVTYQLIPEK
ncbi:unnamed protein product [Psylliodes chrysocephalus]|uniref:Pesticidal crystal protein domain-containing protein n=1 Tax=Psylliodes chrysocephalus TaxID=3402493 RepID=A0A9P0CYV0_9CUCU|nr:unnamed protein product [Psylliodes chrysocephala]